MLYCAYACKLTETKEAKLSASKHVPAEMCVMFVIYFVTCLTYIKEPKYHPHSKREKCQLSDKQQLYFKRSGMHTLWTKYQVSVNFHWCIKSSTQPLQSAITNICKRMGRSKELTELESIVIGCHSFQAGETFHKLTCCNGQL